MDLSVSPPPPPPRERQKVEPGGDNLRQICALSFWSARSGSGPALGMQIRIKEGLNDHKSEENSSFEILFGGMKTSSVARTSFMEAFFSKNIILFYL
jgi:hypothetical protein